MQLKNPLVRVEWGWPYQIRANNESKIIVDLELAVEAAWVGTVDHARYYLGIAERSPNPVPHPTTILKNPYTGGEGTPYQKLDPPRKGAFEGI